MSKKPRPFYIIVILSSAAIFLSLWLIALYSPQHSVMAIRTLNSSRRPRTVDASPTSTATSTNLAKQCGTITLSMGNMLLPADVSAAKQANNCFWQAYQGCKPASLLVQGFEVDTGLRYTFTIQPQHGSCPISNQEETLSAAVKIAPNTYTCTGLQKSDFGLSVLDCGTLGTIVIPNRSMPGY